jgi:hypothetical protein
MGTASFMKKMDVRIPPDINLKTGIFLAVDHQLTAVFAVKYQPSDQVDFALRMTQRSRILPILAVRDPNITPQLLQRKFHKGVRVQYPDITTRVALSEAENDRDLPRGGRTSGASEGDRRPAETACHARQPADISHRHRHERTGQPSALRSRPCDHIQHILFRLRLR